MSIEKKGCNFSQESASHLVNRLTEEGRKNLLDALVSHNTNNLLEDSLYLQDAPNIARQYYLTLGSETKAALQKIFRYTKEGINVLIDNQVIPFEKENLAVEDQFLIPNEIERDGTETFFTQDALIQYTTEHIIPLPTIDIYEAIAKIMPAQDYKNKQTGSVAVFQLYKMLGGAHSGIGYNSMNNEYLHNPQTAGGLRSASPSRSGDGARALQCRANKGLFPNLVRKTMIPARALRR